MSGRMIRQRLVQHLSPYTGFTLSEVLIAMVVLSIGLLGLSAMTLAMGKSLTLSQNLTIATTLAQDKIEAVKQTPYAQVDAADYPLEDYNTIPGYPQFRRAVVIHSNSPLADTKTVIVTTSWPRQRSAEPYTVTLTTVINKQ
jgi:prepilin-type N-terminal cleavage/methylation domain-containing protein